MIAAAQDVEAFRLGGRGKQALRQGERNAAVAVAVREEDFAVTVGF